MRDYTGYEPQLFPNEACQPEEVVFPQMASLKLDGIRMVFRNGTIRSRKGKIFKNEAELIKRFKPIVDFTASNDVLLDGELYSTDFTFHQIGSFESKEGKQIPPNVKFYCFDCVSAGVYHMPAHLRYQASLDAFQSMGRPECMIVLEQTIVQSVDEIKYMFKKARAVGIEGLILKSPSAPYKCGRVTKPSGDGYKLKEWVSGDGQIIRVEQATKVDPKAEKKRDEYGYSKTSRKKADRIPVEKASGVVVLYEGKELTVPLSGSERFRKWCWEHRGELPGHWVEYKYQPDGMVDLPRLPGFMRFRSDLDDEALPELQPVGLEA